MNDNAAGWIGTAVAVIFFGSMFVPIKPYDMRDGFFVQWMQACGILTLGAFVHLIRGCPTFYTLAFEAGIIWATGNICTVPIINMIGSGLGFMIWGSVQIITGWATGRFGWFGLNEEVPKSDFLQYLGVALTLASAVLFVLVKPAENRSQDVESLKTKSTSANDVRKTWATKAFAVLLAIFAGFMFGENLTPVTYLEEKVDGASPHGLDHAFAFSAGVAIMATLYFVVYCVWKGNRPYINQQVALPAFVYGIFWAIAQFAWFVASEKLSQSVTFPIITRVPAIIATLWGVLVFREIRGTTNLLLLAAGIVVALTGVILVGLSDEVTTRIDE